MHIVNIMLSRGQGGIEQAFVDYCQALQLRGHRVTAIIYPGAMVEGALAALGLPIATAKNFGQWDMFAVRRLRRTLRKLSPDAVIGHGMRAYVLGRGATRGLCPMVGITHNYSTKRLNDADAVFAITGELRERVLAQGIDASRVFPIPNMVRLEEKTARGPRRNPPVIGSMGRFVAKKGFLMFIDALALLKKRGYAFKAILGGAGFEEDNLKQHAAAAGIDEVLIFSGWVENKKTFFESIDIFCLPSLHEPFGIVLLEAFAHGVPVVSSDSEGPSDIITPDVDALLVGKGDAAALADALGRVLDDAAMGDALAEKAYKKVKNTYAMEAVAGQIEGAFSVILRNAKR